MLVKNCARFGWHSCLSHGEFAASRQRHSEPTTGGCLELASWNIGAEKQASYLPGLYCLHSSLFLKVHLVPNIKWSRHDVGILHERSSVAEPDVGSVVSEMTKQLHKPNLVRKNVNMFGAKLWLFVFNFNSGEQWITVFRGMAEGQSPVQAGDYGEEWGGCTWPGNVSCQKNALIGETYSMWLLLVLGSFNKIIKYIYIYNIYIYLFIIYIYSNIYIYNYIYICIFIL
jgi:hypothetical protein